MPLTKKQREKTLEEAALCDLLPIRDYLDNVMIRTSGELVAGYALKGAMSYFADDNGRNSTKHHLEALLRTIPEESMRLQFRFEITEDLAELLERYEHDTKTNSEAALLLEQSRIQMWREKERLGMYLRRITHVYLIWNPEKHHQVLGVRRTVDDAECRRLWLQSFGSEADRANPKGAPGHCQRV